MTTAVDAGVLAAAGEHARSRHRAGRILAAVNLAAAVTCAAVILAIFGITRTGLLECIRVLTPIGILFFLAAFVARPLHDLVRGDATRWLVANRRYVGLSFASWHLMHWPILAAFLAVLGPAGFWHAFGSFFGKSIWFLLIITAMAATSNDRSQRWLGMRAWSAFHLIGMYATWVWAFRIYLLRFPDRAGIHEHVYIWLFLAALAIRWIAAGKRLYLRLR